MQAEFPKNPFAGMTKGYSMFPNLRAGTPGIPGIWRARFTCWPLVPILAIASFARFHRIGREPLWIDEGYSWWDARQSFADLWTLVPQCDPHPPLYFLLLKGWIALFGDSAMALRTPSAILGIASTAVVYAAGREVDGERGRGIAWVAALLFALAPFQIYFSNEARPYALLCLGAALIVFGALRVANGDLRVASRARALSGWIALGLGAAIVLWSNNTSVLLIASLATGLLLVYSFDRHRALRWRIKPAVIVAIAVTLLWLPDVPVLLAQVREVSDDFWIQPPNLARLHEELHWLIGIDSWRAVWPMVALMAGGLALLAQRGLWREALVIASLAILPVALNVAVSATVKPILLARALIGATPAFVLAIAAGVCLIGDRRLRAAAIVALVAAHAIGGQKLLAATGIKEPWDRIAELVQHEGTSDHEESIAFVVPNEMALPLAHALAAKHVAVPIGGVPADFPATGMNARYPSGKCAPSVVGQDLSPIGAAARGKQRVYLVTRRNNVYDPEDRVGAYLQAQGLTLSTVHEFNPGDLRILRFVPPS